MLLFDVLFEEEFEVPLELLWVVVVELFVPEDEEIEDEFVVEEVWEEDCPEDCEVVVTCEVPFEVVLAVEVPEDCDWDWLWLCPCD